MQLPIPAFVRRGAVPLNRSTTATLPGLQGSAVRGSTGGTVANGTTYREVVPVAGHAAVRIRLLTVTSTGTLTVTPIRPVGSSPEADQMDGGGYIDTTKVTKYTTGGVAKAVAAATEVVVDVNLCGENYVLVEFACTANGTITYCDCSQIDVALPTTSAGVGVAVSGLQPVLIGGQDGSGLLQTLRTWLLSADANAIGGLQGLLSLAVPMVYNGATFDRTRNNSATTLLASAARTTTQTSADITVYNERFLDVILDMTVVGTGSVTVTINGKDATSGKYYLLLTGAAVTTNVTNVYRVGAGLLAAANAVANFALPRTIQIVVTANNANSAVYSVGYNLSV